MAYTARMTSNQLKRKLQAAHIPDVSKLTGIPLRTLYRLAAQPKAQPSMRTYQALMLWAKK